MDGRAGPEDEKGFMSKGYNLIKEQVLPKRAGWSVSDEQRKYEMTKEGQNELQRSELLE